MSKGALFTLLVFSIYFSSASLLAYEHKLTVDREVTEVLEGKIRFQVIEDLGLTFRKDQVEIDLRTEEPIVVTQSGGRVGLCQFAFLVKFLDEKYDNAELYLKLSPKVSCSNRTLNLVKGTVPDGKQGITLTKSLTSDPSDRFSLYLD